MNLNCSQTVNCLISVYLARQRRVGQFLIKLVPQTVRKLQMMFPSPKHPVEMFEIIQEVEVMVVVVDGEGGVAVVGAIQVLYQKYQLNLQMHQHMKM